jgi:hypothetical protein
MKIDKLFDNKIYVNQVRFGKKEPIYELSNNYFVKLKIETEIYSMKLAKLIDKIEDKKLILDYKECKFLYNLIVDKKKIKGMDFFIKNNILNKKGEFKEEYSEFNEKNNFVTDQVTDQVKILYFCKEPKSRAEIMNLLKLKHIPTFRNNYLKPLLNKNLLKLTNIESPKSPNQKYIITNKGLEEIEYE